MESRGLFSPKIRAAVEHAVSRTISSSVSLGGWRAARHDSTADTPASRHDPKPLGERLPGVGLAEASVRQLSTGPGSSPACTLASHHCWRTDGRWAAL